MTQAINLAKQSCKSCGGTGVAVGTQGPYAHARLCTCWGSCERCHDSGQAVAEVDGHRVAGRCRCQVTPDRIALFNVAEIPARHAGSTLQSFMEGARRHQPDETTRVVMEVSTWKARFKPGIANQGLVLYGKVGRGKTHLLVAILRDLVLQHGAQVRFVEFSRLLSLLKEGYSEGRSDSAVLSELSRIEVLGIDELGKGRLTPWELNVIDDVISRRYNALGCTLATTNYPPGAPTGANAPNFAVSDGSEETLGDRTDARVYSRLVQMGDFLEVVGKDFRTVRS